MAAGRYRFDSFHLDPVEWRLFAGETLVELNSRYFDALLLLLQHPGTLLSKERFLQEVWHGPVSDEVLTNALEGALVQRLPGRRAGAGATLSREAAGNPRQHPVAHADSDGTPRSRLQRRASGASRMEA
ncbi:MAG TPA: winged helix-turn-helix domain-containing protein [Gammaproteobacteria bacterium]|jgi:hypothetical protein